MKYLLMIYGNREKWESVPAEAWPEGIARQQAFNAKYRETGELLRAYGLADAVNAKLVRRADGLPAITAVPVKRVGAGASRGRDRPQPHRRPRPAPAHRGRR